MIQIVMVPLRTLVIGEVALFTRSLDCISEHIIVGRR
jgi:hypothetical protein